MGSGELLHFLSTGSKFWVFNSGIWGQGLEITQFIVQIRGVATNISGQVFCLFVFVFFLSFSIPSYSYFQDKLKCWLSYPGQRKAPGCWVTWLDNQGRDTLSEQIRKGQPETLIRLTLTVAIFFSVTGKMPQLIKWVWRSNEFFTLEILFLMKKTKIQQLWCNWVYMEGLTDHWELISDLRHCSDCLSWDWHHLLKAGLVLWPCSHDKLIHWARAPVQGWGGIGNGLFTNRYRLDTYMRQAKPGDLDAKLESRNMVHDIVTIMHGVRWVLALPVITS